MTIAAEKIISVRKNPSYVAFDKSGKNVNLVDQSAVCAIAKQADSHYMSWNKLDLKNPRINTGLGIGAVVALFEAVTAVALGVLEKSPATFTNAATTFSECVQVVVANISPKHEKLSENVMASVISVAGASGFYKWAKDMINLAKGEADDLQTLPLWQKTGLSIASFLSSVMMFLGWSEKNSLAPLAKEQNGGFKGTEMRLNGSSDMRCSFEWLMMTIFPWFKQFKLFKIPIDLALPLLAMQDGVGHFVEKLLEKYDKAENELSRGLKTIFGLNDSSNGVPSLFFKPWFFGEKEGEGFRAKYLLPLYRYFGCEDPVICHMNQNSELVVKVPGVESIREEEVDSDLKDSGQASPRVTKEQVSYCAI